MLVKSCGPELVDQSKRLHEMGGFLGKSGSVNISRTLLSSSLPPMPYPFFQRACDTRSTGVSRIASLIYRGILASQNLAPSWSVEIF